MDLLASDTTGLAVMIGLAAPWIIAAINRPNWSRTVRQGIAIAVSAVLGAGVAYVAGTFHSGWTVLGAAATVLATSQAIYGRLFTGTLRAVEYLTSGQRPPPEPPSVIEDAPGRHATDRAA